MTITKCDICGRTASEGADIFKYKLKREWHSWYESGWERLDICYDCIREIRKRVKETKNG